VLERREVRGVNCNCDERGSRYSSRSVESEGDVEDDRVSYRD
jgi:hypothetical protein